MARNSPSLDQAVACYTFLVNEKGRLFFFLMLLMENGGADSKAYNLFPGSDLEKWRENLPALVEINVPDKGLIYREGDRCTKVFCIINGVVKLSVMTAQGNELTTALLRQGEIFGSLSAAY
ncbi:MAG: Crp/Fnr family transcriptional regulator [Pyrinomonadaceae bacterium]